MEKITRVVCKCEYCGYEDTREDFMEFHEACCALNPKNQPCSICSNMILGIGCSKGMDPEEIGGNILCFFYSKGIPQNPLESILKLPIDTSDEDNDNET